MGCLHDKTNMKQT